MTAASGGAVAGSRGIECSCITVVKDLNFWLRNGTPLPFLARCRLGGAGSVLTTVSRNRSYRSTLGPEARTGRFLRTVLPSSAAFASHYCSTRPCQPSGPEHGEVHEQSEAQANEVAACMINKLLAVEARPARAQRHEQAKLQEAEFRTSIEGREKR
jgi:hypothetical protein